MALLTLPPTRFDEMIASEVSSHTDRSIERAAGVVTWGADEHVLLGLAAIGWLLTRNAPKAERRLGDHFMVCSLATAALPHIMKRLIDQERPDRLTIKGHLRGIPLSGKSEDAFPSGHALHVGALASAATLLPPPYRNLIWGMCTALVTTRIVLLAHWFSDVVAGLALGVGVERGFRLFTKPKSIN
jgi:membrane-associated phospholipid phosphatase